MKAYEFVNILDISSITALSVIDGDNTYSYNPLLKDLTKFKEICPCSDKEVKQITIEPDIDGGWIEPVIIVK